MDTIEYRTGQNQFMAEWQIIDGANYIEGIDSAGPFVNVNWIEPGTHEILLRLIHPDGDCSSLWSDLLVTVHERPEVAEMIDTSVCIEEIGSLFLEIPLQPGETLYWTDPGLVGSQVEILSEGIYDYIQTNTYGCADTGIVRVYNICNMELFVPEAFTPNGDGINDVLPVFGFYTDIEFSIYSPSGVLLFHATGDNIFWDGTKNGQPLPEGSYYWHINFRESEDRFWEKSGVVTLIR
jgi:gliding motility-associated-like protein